MDVGKGQGLRPPRMFGHFDLSEFVRSRGTSNFWVKMTFLLSCEGLIVCAKGKVTHERDDNEVEDEERDMRNDSGGPDTRKGPMERLEKDREKG
ncbi:hypothetical protein RUM44_004025 [Polyplax serrata]|uniref:Uncharacterized protein n=1 Tax=Polyplax serrata TaxID=468196 RepID=A0ABR1B1N1_POLSC